MKAALLALGFVVVILVALAAGVRPKTLLLILGGLVAFVVVVLVLCLVALRLSGWSLGPH